MSATRETEKARQLDNLLFQIEACYPHAAFDMNALDKWHAALADYEIPEISHALTIHLKRSRYLPTIAEVIQIIEETRNPITVEARSQQQWRVVMSAVRQFGKNRPPQFSDPITANLVRTQFRWSYLCEIEEVNEKWEQKRWCEAFELAADLHKDLVQVEAPSRLHALLDTVTKPVEDPKPPPKRAADDNNLLAKMRAYKQRLKRKHLKPKEKIANDSSAFSTRSLLPCRWARRSSISKSSLKPDIRPCFSS